MSSLPNAKKTVKLLKGIRSEGVDLASEKRRFQGFLQDYAGRARAEQARAVRQSAFCALCGPRAC